VGHFYPPGSRSGSTYPIRNPEKRKGDDVPGGRGLVDGAVGSGLEDDLINSNRLLTQHQLTVVLNKISLFKLVCGPKSIMFNSNGKKKSVELWSETNELMTFSKTRPVVTVTSNNKKFINKQMFFSLKSV
jgi:hypothetical protein